MCEKEQKKKESKKKKYGTMVSYVGHDNFFFSAWKVLQKKKE